MPPRYLAAGLALAALATVALWLGLGVAAAQEPLRVVASIKPVHALVAGVMAGAGEPTLLVTGGRSPHAYALRPSEARALERADVVFWVGEALESFLQKPLQALSSDARIVALHRAEGVVLLAAGGIMMAPPITRCDSWSKISLVKP